MKSTGKWKNLLDSEVKATPKKVLKPTAKPLTAKPFFAEVEKRDQDAITQKMLDDLVADSLLSGKSIDELVIYFKRRLVERINDAIYARKWADKYRRVLMRGGYKDQLWTPEPTIITGVGTKTKSTMKAGQNRRDR
jgi:hypothetical protein